MPVTLSNRSSPPRAVVLVVLVTVIAGAMSRREIQSLRSISTILAQAGPSEPNDVFAQAYGPLASNATYVGYVWPHQDFDYFYFDAPQAGLVEVVLQGVPTAAPTRVRTATMTPTPGPSPTPTLTRTPRPTRPPATTYA